MTFRSELPVFRRAFPVKNCFAGAMLGNGRLGLLVWGEGRTLRLTVGLADLWDHRGGMVWTEKHSFSAVAAALNSGDPSKIAELFPPPETTPATPSTLPFGRIEVTLPEELRLGRYELRIADGELAIFCDGEARAQARVMTLRIGMERENCFTLGGLPPGTAFKAIPAWDLTGELAARGIPEPERRAGGFTQTLPADKPCSLETELAGSELRAAAGRSGEKIFLPLTLLEEDNRRWWQNFWEGSPRITLGNPLLQELFYLNLYKAGAMCRHPAVPPGLQGPWIEDDALPPWGSDYHFNINVQMCFMWAFKAGKSAVLRPLFDMIRSWDETLRHNARCFTGKEGGVMLPHAVDDRGRCMGNFWSGAVDHGCTAWAAQLMFEYFRYSGDEKFLREYAFGFMKSAMTVFRRMLVREKDGRLQLPLSVSPEYRSDRTDAWGVNASFQLAAIHRLARDLISAAKILGEEIDGFWIEAEHALPQAELAADGGEIALWRGTVLEESHRHHSHLACVFPFDTIDAENPAWREIFRNTLNRWYEKGMGLWAGWSFAWASMLHTRFGNPVMAEFCLELWHRFFTDEGGGSLHDPVNGGLSVINFGGGRRIMQMDGALGVLSAIQDMFFFESQGIFKFFYGVPRTWELAEFRNLAAPGGIRVGGVMKRGESLLLEIFTPRKCTLRLTLPDAENFFVGGSKVRTITIDAGKRCRLTRKKEEFL